jgi:hypothetical protein
MPAGFCTSLPLGPVDAYVPVPRSHCVWMMMAMHPGRPGGEKTMTRISCPQPETRVPHSLSCCMPGEMHRNPLGLPGVPIFA